MPYKSMALHAIDRFFEPMALRTIGNSPYTRRRHQLHVLGQPAAGED
jgi:hypothetical protein